MKTHYRIVLQLPGGTEMILCTLTSAEAVGPVLITLCRADKPGYSAIRVELVPAALTDFPS